MASRSMWTGSFAPARGDTTGAVLGQGFDVLYACPVENTSRSKMNVSFTFRGGDEALEKKFSVEAQWVKFFMLAGHRSVDGCRASLYNGLPLEGVEALCSFMKSFFDAGSLRQLRSLFGNRNRIVSVFSAELGSTADTRTASLYGAF